MPAWPSVAISSLAAQHYVTAAASCFALLVGLGVIRGICVFSWGRCRSTRSLKGKTVIITGANSGIGRAAAKELAKRQARVIFACRDAHRAQQAVQEVRRHAPQAELVVRQLDLASITSVRKFAEEVLISEEHIDVLINNAGVFHCPEPVTQDGFEIHMGVNHLGHFLLTKLLLDRIKASAPARIIVVTSSLHTRGKIDFDHFAQPLPANSRQAYSNSKLANTIFAVELSRRLGSESGVDVYAVSPGFVWTRLGRHIRIPWYKTVLMLPVALFFVRTPSQGCQTVVHCAVSEEVQGCTGHFYRNCKEHPLSRSATDEEIGRKLWEVSERLTNTA